MVTAVMPEEGKVPGSRAGAVLRRLGVLPGTYSKTPLYHQTADGIMC